jgi:O-antigen/teichoic acid export membrane protein
MTTSRPDYNVARGTAYITGQQVVVYLTYFVFYVVTTRVLSRAEIGAVSLLAAIMAAFNTITQLALPQAATRYISRHLASGERSLAGSVASTTLRLTILLAVPLAFVGILLTRFINTTLFVSGVDYTVALVVTFICGVVIDVYLLYGAYFLGAGLYAEYAYQTILYIPLSRGLGIALALLGWGVLGIIVGWLIGGIAAIALSVFYWHGRLPEPRNYPLTHLLGFTLPLFVATLITLGQQWGDVAILQLRIENLATTGGYYVIISSVGFLSAFWFPVANALYPSLSAAHSRGDKESAANSLALSFRLTNLAVLPLGAAVAAVASTALIIAYGEAYGVDAIAFAILTIATIFQAQSAILTTTLQAFGKTRVLLLVTVTATIIDLAWVWLFAPVLTTTAGAIGRTLLYVSTVYLSYRVLRKETKAQPFHGFLKALALALGVGVPMFVANQVFIDYLPLRPLLRLPILLAIFGGFYLGISRELNIFHAGDFAILKDALPRRYHPFLKRVERLILSRQTDKTTSGNEARQSGTSSQNQLGRNPGRSNDLENG